MEIKVTFKDGKVHVATSEKVHPFTTIGILEIAKQTVIMNGGKPEEAESAEAQPETPSPKE